MGKYEEIVEFIDSCDDVGILRGLAKSYLKELWVLKNGEAEQE